jgi:hypothetical protein
MSLSYQKGVTMKIKTIALGLAVLGLTACAVPFPNKAANVQVHSQMSTLLTSCQKLGLVQGYATGCWVRPTAEAKIDARSKVADLGGDTLAITNIDETQSLTEFQTSVQGTAMKCH